MKRFSIDKKNAGLIAFVFAVFSFSSLLTVILISDSSIHAVTQTASQTAGPNTISMSNNDSVAIDVVPTSEQAIYTGTNTLSVTNSCPSGATITLTTNSNSDTVASNNLVRSGSDDLSKIIAPTTGSNLVNNSWGYSINGGTNYYAVPAKDQTPVKVYDSMSADLNAVSVNVLYGIKMDNNIPSGNYSNDVIYTVAVKPACLSYGVTWNLDGGTGASGATYPTELQWGQTINLSSLTPTKDGFTFAGWSNGSSVFNSNGTNVDINSGNNRSVTMTAQWTAVCDSRVSSESVTMTKNQVKNYDYTGSAKCTIFQSEGYYKVEAWGAQGYSYNANYRGGYGGYSVGITRLSKNSALYVLVGQAGYGGQLTGVKRASWPNGGMSNGNYSSGGYEVIPSGGSGGGSTHIFNKFASPDQSTPSDIIIAAGGGGSAVYWTGWNGIGGNGGGYVGMAGTRVTTDTGNWKSGGGGTQTAGGTNSDSTTLSGAYGMGGALSNGPNVMNNAGGGGGYYGGAGSFGSSGGGGSGYIGNSLLVSSSSLTKHMTCYSCSTSTAAATRTNSNTNVSATATADYSKTGNGYARITYLGTSI